MIVDFYLRERAELIGCLVAIFAASQDTSMKALVSFKDELLGKGALLKQIIKALIRNLKWQSEIRMLEEAQARVELCIQLEQIKMLELVFTISQEQNLSNPEVQMAHIKKFLKYLVLTDFKGFFISEISQDYRQLHQSEISILNEQKIKDLGIFTMLSLLRIDLF